MKIMPEVVFTWTVLIPAILASLLWLYRDVKRHSQPSLLWVVLTLVFAYPAGLIAWLLLRGFVKPPQTT